jgi:hypothetical protein
MYGATRRFGSVGGSTSPGIGSRIILTSDPM